MRDWLKAILFIGFILQMACTNRLNPEWPEITPESKPWTYWWWMGNAVDNDNITANLEKLAGAGFGGVHIVPIYGVKGFEKDFIQYLSPQWMNMLRHTTLEAARLTMGVDLTTGTGWPFGGPQVEEEDADAKVVVHTYSLGPGERLNTQFDTEQIQVLMAYGDGGKIIELTRQIDDAGRLTWEPEKGRWDLIMVSQSVEGARKVKRAAPGGEGYCVNPFSKTAMEKYLVRFDSAFSRPADYPFRAFYHDSYEYRGDWTPELFDRFQKRRGYDLKDRLPELFSEAQNDTIARIKSDYRETLSDLLHEDFISTWVAWSKHKGYRTRNQAHGSPGNLLDLYAAADIPETEIFGPSHFTIPDLRRDPDFDNEPPDPLALKFASSAAHVSGRPLVSSETCTWLGEHFKVSLAQVKPELDQLWVCGINHVFFHGVPYSPVTEAWPGWLFYASTHFGPTAGFWRDLPALNEYIARVQSILQSGQPDNDILVYWPFHDAIHDPAGMVKQLSVHNLENWLSDTPFHDLTRLLWEQGYSFDYTSDRLLDGASAVNGVIRLANINYKTLIIPACRFMPVHTLENILELVEKGTTVIFHGKPPADVPGLGNLKSRRNRFNVLMKELAPGNASDKAGNRVLIAADPEQILKEQGILREPLKTAGIDFIRRQYAEGYYYFLANLSGNTVDRWIALGTPAEVVEMLDPLTGETGFALVRKTAGGRCEIYVQLKPGQSLILRTFLNRSIQNSQQEIFKTGMDTFHVTGTWQISFSEGVPVIPAAEETDTLISWTSFSREAMSFQGTATYTISFEKPATQADNWILELGNVCESARVRINGKEAGMLFCLPFEIRIGAFLKDGTNVLEIEVTNLSANRIADLDRKGVVWRKFYDINYVNIQYEPFDASEWPPMDSGLLGPVRLRPVFEVNP